MVDLFHLNLFLIRLNIGDSHTVFRFSFSTLFKKLTVLLRLASSSSSSSPFSLRPFCFQRPFVFSFDVLWMSRLTLFFLSFTPVPVLPLPPRTPLGSSPHSLRPSVLSLLLARVLLLLPFSAAPSKYPFTRLSPASAFTVPSVPSSIVFLPFSVCACLAVSLSIDTHPRHLAVNPKTVPSAHE